MIRTTRPDAVPPSPAPPGALLLASFDVEFAALGLTQSLAVEFAKTGITVNAVGPGIADTLLPNQLVVDITKAVPA